MANFVLFIFYGNYFDFSLLITLIYVLCHLQILHICKLSVQSINFISIFIFFPRFIEDSLKVILFLSYT